MIRLVQRRLIIPQGDTGTFTIPTLGTVENGDLAVLTIYDPMKNEILIQKTIAATEESLTFEFAHNDTKDIEPAYPPRYQWDIKIYRNPTVTDGKIIDADEVDSYYAAFAQPPICDIRRAP